MNMVYESFIQAYFTTMRELKNIYLCKGTQEYLLNLISRKYKFVSFVQITSSNSVKIWKSGFVLI